MSDAKLKKKVQLKQKTEEPVVQLKRKGGAATAVHLKRKSGQEAAVATTAAEAASATMTPKTTAAQIQNNPANAAAAPSGRANNPKIAPVSTPSGEKSTSNNSSTATTGNSGKVVGWILGVAIIAGLAFGGYKLIDSNTGDNDLLADSGTIVTSNDSGNRGANTDLTDTQESCTETDSGTGNNNDTTVANNTSNSASGANGTKESAKNTVNNSTSNVAGVQDENEGSQSTSSHGSNDSVNTAGVAESDSAHKKASNETVSSAQTPDNSAQLATDQDASTGKVTTATDSTTATGIIGGKDASVTTVDDGKVESHVPVFTVNMVSESNAECLFDFDSSAVTENQTLNDIAEIAKNSGKSVMISGFTDKVGSYDYNQRLSNRRANAVKAYLVKRGVSSEKIKANGYGISNTYPTNAKNRRADITLE